MNDTYELVITTPKMLESLTWMYTSGNIQSPEMKGFIIDEPRLDVMPDGTSIEWNEAVTYHRMFFSSAADLALFKLTWM